MADVPHRRPPRLPSFDYRGCHRYFVTCCVADRRPVFADGDAVAAVHEQMLDPNDPWELAHYRTRIPLYYPGDERVVTALLDALAAVDEPSHIRR